MEAVLQPDYYNEQDGSQQKKADSENSGLNDSTMKVSMIQNTREKISF